MSSTKRSFDGEGEDDSNKKQKSNDSTPAATAVNPSAANFSRLDSSMMGIIFSDLNLVERHYARAVTRQWCALMKYDSTRQHEGIAGHLTLAANLILTKAQMCRLVHQVCERSAPYSVFASQVMKYLEDDPRRKGQFNLSSRELSAFSRIQNLKLTLQLDVLTPFQPLFPFSKCLTHLTLWIQTGDHINTLMEVIGTLSGLEMFHLNLLTPTGNATIYQDQPHISIAAINFEHLTKLACLEDFHLQFPTYAGDIDSGKVVATQEQIEIIRNLPNLHRLPCSIHHNPRFARRLLEQPHQGWTELWDKQELCPPHADQSDILLKLPNLTKLELRMGPHPFFTHCLFFEQLGNLTDVTVSMINTGLSPEITTNAIESLQHLSNLTRLRLKSSQHLSSDHLETMLPRLSHLRTLELDDCDTSLQSLAFLEHQPPFVSITRVSIIHANPLLAVGNQPQYPLSLPNLTEFELAIDGLLPEGYNAAWWNQLRDRLHDGWIELRFQDENGDEQAFP